jgi:hypothetical protein
MFGVTNCTDDERIKRLLFEVGSDKLEDAAIYKTQGMKHVH